MRIFVYRTDDKSTELQVVPGRRQHLPPVVLRGIDKGDVLAELTEVIRQIRGEVPTAPVP